MSRPEALYETDGVATSPEGQYAAYIMLADYEAKLPSFINSMCTTTETREYPPLNEERRQAALAIIDDLLGTDYAFLPSITVLGNFHGAIISGEHNSLAILAHDSMLAGYSPDQELLVNSSNDFMWDELMEGEIPEFTELESKYGWYGRKDIIPEVSEPFRGYIVPRTEVRQMLATLYDRAYEYRHTLKWGYPNWSDQPTETIE